MPRQRACGLPAAARPGGDGHEAALVLGPPLKPHPAVAGVQVRSNLTKGQGLGFMV